MTDPLKSIARETAKSMQDVWHGDDCSNCKHLADVAEAACRSVLRAFVQQVKEKLQEEADSNLMWEFEALDSAFKIADTVLAEWDRRPTEGEQT